MGDIQAKVFGNVPFTMPQSPQAGAHLGHAYATQFASAPSALTGDCLGVVYAANDPSARPNRKRMHAASTLFCRLLPSRQHITEERWVKAHVVDAIAKLKNDPPSLQAFVDILSSQAQLDALANSEADFAAKDGHELDVSNLIDQPVFDFHARAYAKTLRIARAIATMLSLRPSNEQKSIKHERKPPPSALRPRPLFAYLPWFKS